MFHTNRFIVKSSSFILNVVTTDFYDGLYFRLHYSGISVKGYIEGFRTAGKGALVIIHAKIDNGLH